MINKRNNNGVTILGVMTIITVVGVLLVGGIFIPKFFSKKVATVSDEVVFRKDIKTYTDESQPSQPQDVSSVLKNPLQAPTSTGDREIPSISESGAVTSSVIQLKSKFFRGDQEAKNIKEGRLVLDIRDSGLEVGKVLNESSFAWKFLNGLRQIGYVDPAIPFETITIETPFPAVRVLNRFQKLNKLPLSDKITKEAVIKLDELLYEREIQDTKLASEFPLTDSILTYSHDREIPHVHLGALFTIAFKVLPPHLVEWSMQNFLDFIRIQGPGGDGLGFRVNQEGKICFPNYFPRFNEQCEITAQEIKQGGFKDDFNFVYNLLHEYAHYLDGGKYHYERNPGTSRGVVNTDEFLAISFDTSSLCNSNPVYANWSYYKLKNPNNLQNEFVTDYALGWTSLNSNDCRSSVEDFAESFAIYILQGNVFRKLAENKPVLAQKYIWLKQNVFAGKEYSTGDASNIPLVVEGLQQPYQPLLASFTSYSFINPNFVWDYLIKARRNL